MQNALDAVRQRLAYQRLAQIDAGLADDEAALATMHSIEIRVHSEGGRWMLTCTDTGIGMTKEILRRRFLATGSRPGHREAELDRRCRLRGFSAGRTGQFGIGAVSYFMLADLVKIDTHRSQDALDAESNGWALDTRGIDDIAEPRKGTHTLPGTAVTFNLSRTVVKPSAKEWFESLAAHLRETILKVPCRFTVRFEKESPVIAWVRGWTRTESDLRMEILEWMLHQKSDDESFDSLSKSRQKELQDDQSAVQRLAKDVDAALHIITEEGDLPENTGTYRGRCKAIPVRL